MTALMGKTKSICWMFSFSDCAPSSVEDSPLYSTVMRSSPLVAIFPEISLWSLITAHPREEIMLRTAGFDPPSSSSSRMSMISRGWATKQHCSSIRLRSCKPCGCWVSSALSPISCCSPALSAHTRWLKESFSSSLLLLTARQLQ